MTEEVSRAQEAVRQAKAGKKVAVISSGDAGVYTENPSNRGDAKNIAQVSFPGYYGRDCEKRLPLMEADMREKDIRSHAMILAGWALDPNIHHKDEYRSKLYDKAFTHRYRRGIKS